MTERNPRSGTHKITQTIINSLAELFDEPEFDNDDGVVRFLDRDDRCVWLGLFPTDDEGQVIGEEPSITWTIEVSEEMKGVRS